MSGETGVSLARSPGCYGRISPRCSLELKKFIDVGVGAVDRDYGGEVGVI